MCATNVSIKGNRTIAGGIISDSVGVGNILVPIHKDVRMSIAPNKRAILDSRDEERQLLHLILQVPSSDAAREAVDITYKDN
jgi:hypothetical protein